MGLSKSKMETESKLNSALDQIKHIRDAIRLTQRLRTHVFQIFRDLGDGISDSVDTEGENQEQAQEKQKVVLGTLRNSLETVGQDLGDLEKVGQTLLQVTPSANCDHVSLDP